MSYRLLTRTHNPSLCQASTIALSGLLGLSGGCSGTSTPQPSPDAGIASAPSAPFEPDTTLGAEVLQPFAPTPTAGAAVPDTADSAYTQCGQLRARVRDFSREHPDFEGVVHGQVVTGLVQAELGPDGKPRVDPEVAQQHGLIAFDDWYYDVPEVNEAFEVLVPLEPDGSGRSVFDSNAFFPIDDEGWGNEWADHNFHFTTEIHTRFEYKPGYTFTFAGDDDVWVFINGRLAIDLGGVHGRSSATADLDMLAADLGLTAGASYGMDIFHAERHTGESNFRIETTIACLASLPPE